MFKKENGRLEFTGISVRNIQFFCLLALAVVDFLIVTMTPLRPHLAEFMVETYLPIPALLFLGASLTLRQSRYAVHDFALGIITLVWVALAQCHQCLYWEIMENLTPWWPIYLLVFPFAAAVEDDTSRKGLNLLGITVAAVSMIMAVESLMMLTGTLPRFLSEAVIWDRDARLVALSHPNIASWLFMIGIAFTLSFALQTKKKWLKGLLIAGAGLQLLMQALTNSRTASLMTCALIGGIIFFSIPRKDWKRTVCGLLAALAVAGALFALSNAAYKVNHDKLLAEATAQQEQERQAAQAEQAADPESTEAAEEIKPVYRTRKSFLADLGTLNNRTGIWKRTLTTILGDPIYALRGTAEVGAVAKELHTHNSWIQMLAGFGIPGLLISLYFTFLALRSSLYVIFSRKSSTWQQNIALLMLCMLVAGLLEPFLFTGYTYCHFITVMSIACIGYLNHWYRQLKAA